LTKQTTSLSLSKPEITDKIVDTITQLASNFDVIDSSLAQKAQQTDLTNGLSLKRDKVTLNPSTILTGQVISGSNGTVSANASCDTSDYIPIKPNTNYHVMKYNSTTFYTIYYAFFDASKVFISGGTLSSTADFPISPANAYFIRYSAQGGGNLVNTNFCKSTIDLSTFQKYPFGQAYLNDSNINKTNLQASFIQDNYFRRMLQENFTTFFSGNNNVIDSNLLTTGTLYTNTGTTYSGSGRLSDWIKIDSQVQNFYSNQFIYANFFDANKVFISQSAGNAPYTAITLVTNAKYVRFQTPSGSGAWVVSENNIMYRIPALNEYLLSNTKINTAKMFGYHAKKFTSFGDSLVGNGMWQDNMVSYLNLKHTNCGVGGSTVAGTDGTTGSNPMWTDARINTIPTDTDMIIIHAGTNDHGKSTPRIMGDITSTNTETFYGAYKTMLEKMMTRAPNARIFILQPFWKLNEIFNGENLETYRTAIREIAHYYGFPLYESKQQMGFNTSNYIRYYNSDSGAYIHVNQDGANRVSDCIIGWIKPFAPLYSLYN
jgi:hypothetical protein